MELDNCTICYLGIQRVYRNAMANLISTRLRAKYGAEYATVLQKPFQKEWAGIVAGAQESRAAGLVTTLISDEIDYIGVNHFFNLINSYAGDLAEEPLADATRKQVLAYVREIKVVRDPLSHPGEPDLNADDAFRLLDSAQRTLEAFNLTQAVSEIRELKKQLGDSNGPIEGASAREPLAGRLPSPETIVADFVGRRAEIDSLWAWIDKSDSKLWMLAGEGGKGKSAIAFQFAREVQERAPSPLTAVIWLSAKKRRFLEGEVIAIEEPDFHDLPSALGSVLAGYGGAARLKEDVADLKALALEYLRDLPSLVILDDIDSLEAQHEDTVRFFTSDVSIKTPSRVLLTSRRTVFGLGGVTTHVEGLGEKDAAAFVVSRVKRYELDEKLFAAKRIQEMRTVTEGSPLYLEDLLRLSLVTSPGEAIKKWREKGGSEARIYALGRELEMLGPYARSALVAATVVNGSVSEAELRAITGLSEEALSHGLQELQRLFLVPRPRQISDEPRFELNENTRRLVREVEGSKELIRRFESATKALSGKLSQSGAPGIVQCIRQAVALLQAGHLNKAEATLQKGLAAWPEHPDLLDFLGRVYNAWNPQRVTDARESFRRAAELKCLNEDMYLRWSQMEIDRREWSSGIEAASKGVQRLPASRILRVQAGYCHLMLGSELLRSFQEERGRSEVERARGFYEEALNANHELGMRSINARHLFRGMVTACERLGDRTGVEKYLRRWAKEGAGDEVFQIERERLSRKFGLEHLAT